MQEIKLNAGDTTLNKTERVSVFYSLEENNTKFVIMSKWKLSEGYGSQ